VLTAEDLVGGYGGADILRGVSLEVGAGEIVAVIGPNGAGKSTVMKAIFGLVPMREGRVTFLGDDITALAPDQRVRRGMAYVPQERNVFPSLSVQENLEMGAFVRRQTGRAEYERLYALFPLLAPKRRQPAGELSGGQRQMLALARALIVEPKLLILDEPTAGLSPAAMQEIFACLRTINGAGVALLMVEQNARQALQLADRAYVLATGRNRTTGTGAALLANPEVAASFIGGAPVEG
jgi:branched-chain amino acid transport system ATP-binding protein